jgi:multidrug resistance efflux pump
MITMAGILALGVLLAWPRPHKITCDCQLQPVVRLFVAAPYEGTLDKTLAEPGDVVAEGQVLALMDDREIRLELAAIEAELGRARKSWEAALSLDDIHEAQQARMDMKRFELKTQLLRGRQKNLQITSPIRGLVISGDLENSEGAPLAVGQTLFEIAPLEKMMVEADIPEDDIAHIQAGMEVRIRLDSDPRQILSTRLAHIVPRAEARDDQFVFVGKAQLDNCDEWLRPGMNGRAILIGPRRSLAWILFHKPYESLLMLLGW